MKWLFTALIGLGVVAALCTSLLVASLQAGARGQHPGNDMEPKDIEIMVAARALPAISVVDASAVVAQKVKETELPPGALMTPASVVGQVLVAPVVEGQPFTTNLLAANEPGMHLSAMLPEGMRAVSIVLSSASGLRGLLYPGSIVDIVASFRVQSTDGETPGQRVFSTVLLQGIEVLAVGKESIVAGGNNDSDGRALDDRRQQTVTVMVDAKQAEILQLAMTHGEIALAMRNPIDTSTSTTHGVLLTDISGGLADRLAAKETPPPLVLSSATQSEGNRPGARTTGETPTAMPWVAGPEGVALLGEQAEEASANGKSAVWQVVVLRGLKRDIYEFPLSADTDIAPE